MTCVTATSTRGKSRTSHSCQGRSPCRGRTRSARRCSRSRLWRGRFARPGLVPLVLAMTAAGVVYDLWLKRTAASFVPYIFGLPLLPIWAWACVRDAPPRLWLTYPLGVLVGFGLHLANALPDAERDARGGVRGLVQVAGERAALVGCFGSFAAALAVAVALTWGHAGTLAAHALCGRGGAR